MNFRQKLGAKLFGIKGWDLIDASSFNAQFANYFKIRVGDEEYVGDVFTAIDTWGLYFAKAKFRMYEETRTGKKEVEKHEYLKLFKKPNAYQTWWQIAYTIPTHFGLYGDSYLYKIRQGNKVVAYQQIFPKLIKREFTQTGIIYKLNENDKVLPSRDIIDFKYPSPHSDINGFPIISSIADRATVNKLQMAYLKKFYEEGGFLGLTFTTDKELNEMSFKRTKKLLENEYTGVDNAGKVGLFDSGLKPVPAAYSIKDADVGNQNNLNRDAIFSAFKVSKILVGLGETQNRATAEAAQYQFTSGVIDPILNYIDQIITLDLQMEYGEKYSIAHDMLAAKDQQGKLDYYSKGLKEGWLTINEVRKEEGWNPITGELADITTVNVGGALVSVETGKQIGVEEVIEPDVETPITTMTKSIEMDMRDLRWKQFDRRIGIIERKFANKMEGYFDDQRKRVMDALKDNFIVEQAFNLQEENMLLYQLLEIDVWDIMREGYKYGDYLYGVNQSLDKNKIKREIEKVINSTLNVNSNTLESLKKLENSSLVDEAYKNMGSRIGTIATTVSVSSFNAGLLQAMKDFGLTRKMWLSQRDGRVREKIGGENHVIMDGVLIDIDAPFEVPSRSGYDLLQYPADPTASPENLVNERCTILGEE